MRLSLSNIGACCVFKSQKKEANLTVSQSLVIHDQSHILFTREDGHTRKDISLTKEREFLSKLSEDISLIFERLFYTQ